MVKSKTRKIQSLLLTLFLMLVAFGISSTVAAEKETVFDPATGQGTGFVFEHYDRTGFAWALKTALTTYQDSASWERLRRNGMEVDYSWDKQGAEYEALYRQLVS